MQALWKLQAAASPNLQHTARGEPTDINSSSTSASQGAQTLYHSMAKMVSKKINVPVFSPTNLGWEERHTGEREDTRSLCSKPLGGL